MGFSIDSSGSWLPANRPAAGYPARSARAPVNRSEPVTSAAVRAAPSAPGVARSSNYSGAESPNTERLQRIRQLNPEQSLGMALYAGADRPGDGAGQHLDLRV